MTKLALLIFVSIIFMIHGLQGILMANFSKNNFHICKILKVNITFTTIYLPEYIHVGTESLYLGPNLLFNKI